MLYHFLYPLADTFPVFNLFQYITVRAGGALLTALFLSLCIGPWMIALFKRLQVHFKTVRDDLPARHAETKTGTPSMGGVLIYSTMVLSVLLWSDLTNPYLWVTLGATFAFFLVGFADDFLKMSGRRRGGVPGKIRLLCGFIISVGVVYAFGEGIQAPYAYDVFVPFLKDVIIPLGAFGFTIFSFFVIVGTANGVNLTDGLDGLVIVPVIIAASAFGLIAYVVGRADFTEYLYVLFIPGAAELTVFCAAMVGAGIGFLWFNAHPAQIIMGDTGSLPLGGGLGVVALLTKHELQLAIIGGLFVIVALSTIIQVFSYKTFGRRVFLMAPLHHHFEEKGWPETRIVIRFWIIAFLFALIGVATLKLR